MAFAIAITCCLAQGVTYVEGPRVHLGDIVRVDAPLAAVDLGPSPSPGQRRRVSRALVHQRVHAAQLSLEGVRVPRHVMVARRAQTVAGPAVAERLRALIAPTLPLDLALRAVRAPGLTLPPGPFELRIERQMALHAGTQQVVATCVDGDGTSHHVNAQIDLATVPNQRPVVVERGERVAVLVRSGAVAVRATAVAQQRARVGEETQVLVTGASKVVRATVLAESLVEVVP